MICLLNGTLFTLLSQLLPPVLITEVLLGILGNGLALWFFCFHLKPWKSSTVLLFNLAMADFLLIVALPFRAAYYLSAGRWMFAGGAFCNVNLFMLAMNRTGSIVFLTAVAVDRYVRVVHPHHSMNSLSVHKAVCCASGLWLLTISMTAHLLAISRDNTTSHCESFVVELKTESGLALRWHRSVFLFSFWLPLAVILFCTVQIVVHLRRRNMARDAKIRKALVFIIVVVIIFIICYLPSNVTEILILVKVNSGSEDCEGLRELRAAFYISICMTYLNSTLNPMVYYLSSPSFQKIFRRNVHAAQRSAEAEAAEAAGDRTRETASKDISAKYENENMQGRFLP